MNNLNAKDTLEKCLAELESINLLLDGLGDGSRPAPYLKKYSVIRASGSIESSFKAIIADKVDDGSHYQLKNYIKKNVRESSRNPKYSVIMAMLTEFDGRWKARFQEQIGLSDKPRLILALQKLVDARNSFAHGGNPDLSIADTLTCFKDGIRVMEILDEAVHGDYEDIEEDDSQSTDEENSA